MNIHATDISGHSKTPVAHTLYENYHPVTAESFGLSIYHVVGKTTPRSSCAEIIHTIQAMIERPAHTLQRFTHFAADSLISSAEISVGSSWKSVLWGGTVRRMISLAKVVQRFTTYDHLGSIGLRLNLLLCSLSNKERGQSTARASRILQHRRVFVRVYPSAFSVKPLKRLI